MTHATPSRTPNPPRAGKSYFPHQSQFSAENKQLTHKNTPKIGFARPQELSLNGQKTTSHAHFKLKNTTPAPC
jgi:hypothetical protein